MSASLITITVVGVVKKKKKKKARCILLCFLVTTIIFALSLCLSDVPLRLLGRVYC